MVKALASPPHRILLFLQQSSVEWCSSMWLDSIREIDPTFKRIIIVVSKFDNRIKVENVLLTHASRGGGGGLKEAAAEISQSAARSWLAPLLDVACDRLSFVLGNLFEHALELTCYRESENGERSENMEGYVSFHAALRQAYNRFVKGLSKRCKQLVRYHLDSVTSPYSLVSYETDLQESNGSSVTSFTRSNQSSAISFSLELSDVSMIDQENNPPEKSIQQKTPGKGVETRDPLRECQMTVPETPSPDQPRGDGAVEDLGNGIDIGPRKRVSRMTGNNKYFDNARVQNGRPFSLEMGMMLLDQALRTQKSVQLLHDTLHTYVKFLLREMWRQL